MTATELLAFLRSKGARVRIVEGQLRVRAPKGVVTDELRGEILANKPELVKLLTSYPCTRCQWGRFPVPTVCFHCRRAIALEEERAKLLAGASP